MPDDELSESDLDVDSLSAEKTIPGYRETGVLMSLKSTKLKKRMG
jgi:hypothetical protein